MNAKAAVGNIYLLGPQLIIPLEQLQVYFNFSPPAMKTFVEFP